jgi:hypothetical protein
MLVHSLVGDLEACFWVAIWSVLYSRNRGELHEETEE